MSEVPLYCRVLGGGGGVCPSWLGSGVYRGVLQGYLARKRAGAHFLLGS